jgi:hypothetical protein
MTSTRQRLPVAVACTAIVAVAGTVVSFLIDAKAAAVGLVTVPVIALASYLVVRATVDRLEDESWKSAEDLKVRLIRGVLHSLASATGTIYSNRPDEEAEDSIGKSIRPLEEALADLVSGLNAIVTIAECSDASYNTLCQMFFVGGLDGRKNRLERISEELRFVLELAVPTLRSPTPAVVQAWSMASLAAVEWRAASSDRRKQEAAIDDCDDPECEQMATRHTFAFMAAQAELAHLIVALNCLAALDLALEDGRADDLAPAPIFEDQVRAFKKAIREGNRLAESRQSTNERFR